VSNNQHPQRRVAGNRPRRRALPQILDHVQQTLFGAPDKALSAYDIAAALQASGRRPYTSQIYKALETLVADRRAIHLAGVRRYTARPEGCPDP
jgi:hypothetical protein